MKLLPGLFLLLAINSAFAFPAAQDPDDDAEIVPVLRRQQTSRHDYDTDTDPDFKDFKGVVDTGSGYPFFSVRPYNPFGTGFFDSFEETFRKLRESLLNRWWSSIPQPSDFDPSEGNTTSVVKVIDGHKVEINDTVYTKTDDSGNSIFKVRVVNIRPLDSSEESTTSGPGNDKGAAEDDKGSPEEIERGPQDNEILGNIDSTENTPSTHHALETEIRQDPPLNQNLPSTNFQIEESNQETHGAITNTNIEQYAQKRDELSELSKPSNVEKSENKKLTTAESGEIMEESMRTSLTWIPTSVEQVAQNKKDRESITAESSEEYDNNRNIDNTEWESFNNYNDQNNNIDVYEGIPVDLSNDIAINEMLADQGEPFNPDAEIFSVDEFVPEYKRNSFQYQPIKLEPLRQNNSPPEKK